ncbi:MAG: hypothetical protein MR755_02065 [Faecalibacterium sp.]|nr:hypothetical protein [Faecalibacterium sp.]MDY4157073.1 hypothetical protein [Faecalibacterium sp.]
MKMFKRFAAALLAGVMVLAMLTACGGSGSPIAPESDVEKAEAFYMDVYNAVLEAEYPNDTTLKAEAKKVLEDSLDDNGALKSGKRMIVIQKPSLSVQTVITILPAAANSSTPLGLTSEQLTQAMAQKDATIAKLTDRIGNKLAMMKKFTTKMAVGAVTKGDKTYVAVAVTMDFSKVIK